MEQFISDEEYKELQEAKNKDIINELLSRVYNAAIETMIRKIPDMISLAVTNTVALKNMTSSFYEKNKKFADHKGIVGSVLLDLDSKHPDLSYGDILEKSIIPINEKITALENMPKVVLDKPDAVNLDGNGVIE